MSRCYRVRQTVRVSDSLKRDVTASDEICSELEILEILPCDQMGQLLKQELENRGFEENESEMVRTQDGVTVRVKPETGEVTIRIAEEQELQVEGSKETAVYGDPTETQRKQLRDQLKKELEDRVTQQTGELQRKVSSELEARLGDVSAELDNVVNRVTAAALKEKAKQIGQIKEITEDAETGSLTIKLEV